MEPVRFSKLKTSHRHPVAKMGPAEKTLNDLQIVSAKKPVSTLKKIKGLNLKADLLADLLADRRRRTAVL